MTTATTTPTQAFIAQYNRSPISNELAKNLINLMGGESSLDYMYEEISNQRYISDCSVFYSGHELVRFYDENKDAITHAINALASTDRLSKADYIYSRMEGDMSLEQVINAISNPQSVELRAQLEQWQVLKCIKLLCDDYDSWIGY